MLRSSPPRAIDAVLHPDEAAWVAAFSSRTNSNRRGSAKCFGKRLGDTSISFLVPTVKRWAGAELDCARCFDGLVRSVDDVPANSPNRRKRNEPERMHVDLDLLSEL